MRGRARPGGPAVEAEGGLMMRRHLPAFFACLAVLSMAGAVGVQVIQARSPRPAPPELPLRLDPKTQLSNLDAKIDWADESRGAARP